MGNGNYIDDSSELPIKLLSSLNKNIKSNLLVYYDVFIIRVQI